MVEFSIFLLYSFCQFNMVMGQCVKQVFSPVETVCNGTNMVKWTISPPLNAVENIFRSNAASTMSECKTWCFSTATCLRVYFSGSYCSLVTANGQRWELYGFPKMTYVCCYSLDPSCEEQSVITSDVTCPNGLLQRNSPLYNMSIDASTFYKQYFGIKSASICADVCAETSGCLYALFQTDVRFCLLARGGTMSPYASVGYILTTFQCCTIDSSSSKSTEVTTITTLKVESSSSKSLEVTTITTQKVKLMPTTNEAIKPAMTTMSQTCPQHYCKNGGSCQVNTNKSICSSDLIYCCRCLGNFLPPTCEQVAVQAFQVQITREVAFIAQYEDKSTSEFKQFEAELCFLIHEALRNNTDVSQITCQCVEIRKGSAIGQVIIKGTSALRTTTTSIVESVNRYCQGADTVPKAQCNVTKASSPDIKYVKDSCATASDCPVTTASCSSLDSINYTCTCKTGYFEELKLQHELKTCTESCYSNAVQCTAHGECQQRRGTTINCTCFDGFNGKRCENIETVIIIAVVVSCGVCIVLVLVAVVVAKRVSNPKTKEPIKTRRDLYTTNYESQLPEENVYDIPDEYYEYVGTFSPHI